MIANSSCPANSIASYRGASTDRRESRLDKVSMKWGLYALVALLAGCETTPLPLSASPAAGNPFTVAAPKPRTGRS